MSGRRDRRSKRDLHGVNAEGMVACNPRDREAAHRAQMGDIAIGDPAAVTCGKCRTALSRARKER